MGVPQLVVIAPDSYRGHRIELTREYTTVGRKPTGEGQYAMAQ
jgi:hypothetical protein